MGCVQSSPRVVQKKDRPQRNGQTFPQNRPGMRDHSTEKLTKKQFFHAVTNGIRLIANPSELVPQVCVGDTAFPIVSAVFKLEEPDIADIRLPIISCSLKGNGQLACISCIDFLSQQNFQAFETTMLFKNLSHVLAGGQGTFAQTFCIGFSRNDMRNYKSSFEAMGLFIESGDFPTNLSHYSIIVLNTSYELKPEEADKLYKYVVDDGNGLIVFYNPIQESISINDFLLKFGIRFTNLINGDDGESIEIGQNYEMAKEHTFSEMSKKYITTLQSDDIGQYILDDLVTNLRIYVLAGGDENTPQLTELLETSWNYLKRTNYIKDNKLFQIVQQSIVAMLILDILQKLPLELMRPVEGYEIFPGPTGDVELKDFELDMVINTQEWTSTGLWLPAGVIAEIDIDDAPMNSFIQIGCHTEKNLTRPLPWDRWPSTIITEAIVSNKTKVGSPFGGLVYLMIDDDKDIVDYNVHVKLKGFAQAPHYVIGTDMWQKTKDIDIPWCEIETKNAIVTMPTKAAREFDIEPFATSLERLVGDVESYLAVDYKYKFRIVFDIMMEPGKHSVAYPIVFSTEDIDKLINGVKQPNRILFELLIGIAISLLQTVSIDENTKIAISNVAASAALTNEYKDFTPMMLEDIELPQLFHELWEIHTKVDKTILPRVIASFRDPNVQTTDIPEDMWISFVRNLSNIGGADFSALLSRTRPIPLSVINSLHNMPAYQI